MVGIGKIGTAIADRGHAFGMDVIACDAHDVARPSYVKRFWLLDGLDELLKVSDVVMVTVPITPESRGMISATRLALMKQGSYLIVVSRGGIVDEAALPGFLHSGHLAGAGLDATDPEPLPADSPLWDAPNMIITPHTRAGRPRPPRPWVRSSRRTCAGSSPGSRCSLRSTRSLDTRRRSMSLTYRYVEGWEKLPGGYSHNDVVGVQSIRRTASTS